MGQIGFVQWVRIHWRELQDTYLAYDYSLKGVTGIALEASVGCGALERGK